MTTRFASFSAPSSSCPLWSSVHNSEMPWSVLPAVQPTQPSIINLFGLSGFGITKDHVTQQVYSQRLASSMKTSLNYDPSNILSNQHFDTDWPSFDDSSRVLNAASYRNCSCTTVSNRPSQGWCLPALSRYERISQKVCIVRRALINSKFELRTSC